MMKQPLVSVNITTYNRVHLLSRAIDSVLSQTYPNVEVVVVDDCSTDNTADLIKLYQENGNITYIRHPKNKGNACSRNTALENCSGVFVAFMDDDDEWIEKDKLEKQVNLMMACDDVGLVCTSVRVYHDPVHYIDKVISHPKNLKSKILSGNSLIYNSTVVVRRAVMADVGGFDEKMPKGIDSEFFRRCIVSHNIRVFFMPDVTTAAHEYGEDRMTPVKNSEASAKALSANIRVLRKYWNNYLVFPAALYRRLRTISFLIIKLFKFKWGLHD